MLQLLFLYLTRIYHLTLFDILQNVHNNPVPLDIMGVCDLSVSVKQRSVITRRAVKRPMVLFHFCLFITFFTLCNHLWCDVWKHYINRKEFVQSQIIKNMFLINNSNWLGNYLKSYIKELLTCFFVTKASHSFKIEY